MNTPTLSNADLIEELKQSALEGRQKTALEPLISKMTDAERQELLNLIQQSKEAAEKGKKIYEEGMKTLNAETEKKIKETTKELNKKTLKSFEALEKNGTNAETNKLEADMALADQKTAIKKSKKGNAFKWIALLFIFTAMAISAWLALNA